MFISYIIWYLNLNMIPSHGCDTRLPNINTTEAQFIIPCPSDTTRKSSQKAWNTPQNIIVGNVNTIQRSFLATSSIRFSQRRSEGRHIPGRCIIVDRSVYYIHSALNQLWKVYTQRGQNTVQVDTKTTETIFEQTHCSLMHKKSELTSGSYAKVIIEYEI